jgi:histidine triad (HIT) family protein
VRAATGALGLKVGINNPAAAGQLVPHAHFHLIPRHGGDGLSLWPQSSYAGPEEMAGLAQAIRDTLI